MSNLHEKPIDFKVGSKKLSAGALNQMLNAIPRVIQGGSGVSVIKHGDRILISLASVQGTAPGATCLMTIEEVLDAHLICDRDGASVRVAKPWGLRKGVVFPSDCTYVYVDETHRTASKSGEDDEEQYISPGYEVGEELLCVRIPSARITDAVLPIVWVDKNWIGRYWATLEA